MDQALPPLAHSPWLLALQGVAYGSAAQLSPPRGSENQPKTLFERTFELLFSAVARACRSEVPGERWNACSERAGGARVTPVENHDCNPPRRPGLCRSIRHCAAQPIRRNDPRTAPQRFGARRWPAQGGPHSSSKASPPYEPAHRSHPPGGAQGWMSVTASRLESAGFVHVLRDQNIRTRVCKDVPS